MSPKRIPNARQPGKSVTIYNSSNKKDKKPSNVLEQSRNSVENWEFHFKLADLEMIKSIIKTKDLTGVPLIIGATVLNQKELLLNLLKHGYNINEADKHNFTPLAWSIKLKQLEMVELLLSNNADPHIKPANGDDALCMALGSPLWDEQSFLLLFNHLKNVGKVDVNAMNKHGLSLLHLAVRRQWNFLVDVLILNDVNINIKTNNGVTPLMLASYRNDHAIVTRLLTRGAAVKRRNVDGFTALCYAYSAAIVKELEPPFIVIDKLQSELARNQINTASYLKDRLKLLGYPVKGRHPDQPSPEQMIDHIFTFILRNVDNAFNILTRELSCGKIIKEALSKFIDDRDNMKLALTALNAIFRNINFTVEIQTSVVGGFIKTGCFDVCLKILRRHSDDPTILVLTATPIVIFSVGYSVAQHWYENAKGDIAMYIAKYEEAFETVEGSVAQIDFIHERLKDLKTNICNVPRQDVLDIEGISQDKVDTKNNSKKTKRRAKALKAKIAKMKSAELTERFNMHKTSESNSKPSSHDNSANDSHLSLDGDQLSEHAIHLAIGLIEDDLNFVNEKSIDANDVSSSKSKSVESIEDTEDWKYAIRNLPFHNCINKMFKPPSCNACEGGTCDDPDGKNETTDIDVIIKYLEGLLGIIVNRYKEVWHRDKSNDLQSDDFEYEVPLDPEIERMQNAEKEQLRLVHREFYNLTRNVKESYDLDPECCFNILKELEKFLLSHCIRGETIIDSVAEVELVKLSITMPVDFEKELIAYMENVLAGEIKENEHVKITFKEHLTAEKQFDANSMGDYVYLSEITHLPIRRCMCNDIPTPPTPSVLSLWDESEEKEREAGFNEGQSSATDIPDNKDSKWCSLVRSLEMMDDSQIFLNGAIRISNIEKRKSHVLSLSGNYSVLEIGLAHDNKGLAVKILSKSDPYAILLKSQLDPLLSLRHKYILHYHTCAYDGNLLIIATPLCEYNLGQYVLKMRHPQSQICKVNVIKQMLSGLLFLHDHDEPIVHGNLKPSNVLIDNTGTVKVAEFGIHKAMLKTKNLPDSSIIWFATELYQMHKKDQPLECSCASDIQVAGMLVHFAINCGTHPFGKDVPHILKNLEEAVAEIHANDMELYDLLTWMLLGDPCERPSIHQTLSHIFFWSKQKKWTYILLCAGLGIMSTIPMDIEKLHNSLDRIALKENITGNCWVITAKKQYPEMELTNASDTPSGLLKFIKDVVENNLPLHSSEREKNFSTFILTSFPHFVLSLYRMIENTEWSDHRVFMPFHNVVDY